MNYNICGNPIVDITYDKVNSLPTDINDVAKYKYLLFSPIFEDFIMMTHRPFPVPPSPSPSENTVAPAPPPTPHTPPETSGSATDSHSPT